MMTFAAFFFAGCLAGGLYLIHRDLRKLTERVVRESRLTEAALGDIYGKQVELSREYKEVHAILAKIRDLNTAELQDRKEILQHQNITASNRVVQTRKFMADLEDAARMELERLRHE